MLRYAALAIRNVEFHADRVFDPTLLPALRPSLRPMALPWQRVHAAAAERGLRVLTADRVAEEGIDPSEVMVIAYDWTPLAEDLIRQGARPAVLLSFEPPVIAWELYYHLPSLSARFPHVFLFEGARERAARGTRFHPLYFPQPCPPPRPIGRAWSRRKFLVMINSNKALAHGVDFPRWQDRPREVSLRRELAALRYRPIARDRYAARLRAVEAFSVRPDFDLYGEGWDQRHPAISPRQHAAARRAYRGAVDDKLALLAGYRFALVIENTRFPGYISEKLFDCLYARCIPVYHGAPDVAQYVPTAAMVDARLFGKYADLERFLRGMSEEEAERHLDNAHAFLLSPSFEQFCADRFAKDLVAALLAVGASHA